MKISNEFKRPAFLVSLTLTILFGVTSVVFYYKSKQEAKPTFMVFEGPTKIYDNKTGSSKIKVLDNNLEPINQDVFLISVKFWNSGNLPIEPSEVRVYPTLTITDCNKILDYKIITQTNENISKYILVEDTINSQNGNKNISIKWDHFDPNNGLYMQIIYAGKDSSKIIFTSQFAKLYPLINAKTKNDNLSSLQVLLFFFGLSFIILNVRNFMDRIGKYIFTKNKYVRDFLFWSSLAIYIFGLGYIIFKISDYLFKGLTPPF